MVHVRYMGHISLCLGVSDGVTSYQHLPLVSATSIEQEDETSLFVKIVIIINYNIVEATSLSLE